MKKRIVFALEEEAQRFRRLAEVETESVLQTDCLEKAALLEKAAEIVRDTRTNYYTRTEEKQ